MGEYLTQDGNRSHSFKVFVDGVAKLVEAQFPEVLQGR